jgi:phosphoribosylformylglycinamidine synthase
MKKFEAKVIVMPSENLPDPEGMAIEKTVSPLYDGLISQIRCGRNFQLTVHADDREQADLLLHDICKKFLANPVTEQYAFTISELSSR